MENFFTEKNRVIGVLFVLLLFIAACKQKEPQTRNYIPEEIIVKSLNYILLNKRYDKDLIFKDIRVEKNDLVQYIKPYKIRNYTVSIIDSTKVGMQDPIRNKISEFEFYHISFLNGQTIEVTYAMKPNEMGVKLFFEKKRNEWILIKDEPYFL